MTPERGPRDLSVGSEIRGPLRVMTLERIRWYDDGMLTAARDEPTRAGSNIHTDESYARAQGLPAIIADGMISTNWMSEMLVAHFGMDYVERGELRTKFVRPILIGARVAVRGRVRAVEPAPDGGRTYVLDVWCEDERQDRVTDGDARVTTAAR